VGGVDGSVAVDVHDEAVPGAAVLGGGQDAVQGVAAVADRDALFVHVVGVLPQDHTGETGGHEKDRAKCPHGCAEFAPSGPGLSTHEI
jgi:hypothetical protein